eukprot:TRINITY_DN66116_c0_g1_i1.p1 TRINITY_DN66116_c0_g1~~TRINITY_DN66116_c0_g1_i1.p1  ORF type:complete len:530 (-),score=37.29 TRINITY_DN66116_c0_g1_i1:282-1871(-)
MLNGIKHATRPDAFVVSVDDDEVYGRDHLAVLIYNALLTDFRGTAVAAVATHSRPEFRPCLDAAAWMSGCVGRVHMGHSFGPMTIGWMGTVIRPWFFGPTGEFSVANESDFPVECQRHDDLWLASVLARRGIRRKGINWGLPGQVKTLDSSKDESALYRSNYWNLHTCNHALLERWPHLWEPRPRLVVVWAETHGVGMRERIVARRKAWDLSQKQTYNGPGTGKDVRHAVTRCVGHIDEWYVLGPGSLELVVTKTRFEHDDTVVLTLAGELYQDAGWCASLSAIVQCSMHHLDSLCVHDSSPSAAAGRAHAWRVGAPRRIATGLAGSGGDSGGSQSEIGRVRCWNEARNGTWGRCCSLHRDVPALDTPRPRRQRINARRHGGAGTAQQVPVGCPPPSAGCCAVHPRLSRRWAMLAGRWKLEYDDGETVLYDISDIGEVSVFKRWFGDGGDAIPLVNGEPEWYLEASDFGATVHLRRLKLTKPEDGDESDEVWHLSHGSIRAVRSVRSRGDGRSLRLGAGTPSSDCFGCA